MKTLILLAAVCALFGLAVIVGTRPAEAAPTPGLVCVDCGGGPQSCNVSAWMSPYTSATLCGGNTWRHLRFGINYPAGAWPQCYVRLYFPLNDSTARCQTSRIDLDIPGYFGNIGVQNATSVPVWVNGYATT